MNEWYWQKRSLPQQIKGLQIWEALYINASTTVLLESPANHLSKISRYSIMAGEPRQIWTPPLGEILPCLRSLQDRARALPTLDLDLPFTGGYLGWLGYDLAWEIEKLPYLQSDRLPFPVAFWYEPESFAVVDHLEHVVWLAASSPKQLSEMSEQLDRVLTEQETAKYSESIHGLKSKIQSCHTDSLSFSPSSADYQNMVRKAKEYILQGDIFQTNLSLRFSVEWNGNGWDLYKYLQHINPSPFASYWRTEWGEIISVSPERLIRVSDRLVETRPIAGTRPRGDSVSQDLSLEQELIANAKEQAEHIMLVDLERNDLGRVCEYGSVQVDELLTVERYSHVMHIVSNVIGKLSPDKSAIDAISATFPGGTITGCPKVRCMEIIEFLEAQRRSLFYGSCGYMDRSGNLDLNILIRTLLKCEDSAQVIPNSYIFGQVGAGIVADSIPEKEWQESLQKAKAQLAALGIALPVL